MHIHQSKPAINLHCVGLTFNASGEVVITQRSLVAVPEPGTWALWLLGLTGLGVIAGRRRAAKRATARTAVLGRC